MTDEEFNKFREKWESLYNSDPEVRRQTLEGFSQEELQYYIDPFLRSQMSREEMIEDLLATIASELGEDELSEEPPF